MDSEKSKPILIGVAISCLAGAGVLLYINMGGGSTGAGSSEPIPMICVACGHTYELPVRQFQDLMAQQGPDMMNPMATPRADCPSCNQKGAMTGIKCSGCAAIFVADYMRNPELKCSKCGKSNL